MPDLEYVRSSYRNQVNWKW